MNDWARRGTIVSALATLLLLAACHNGDDGGTVAITGITVAPDSITVTVGSTATLTASVEGASWSTSDVSRATVSSTGVVTAVAPGRVTISASAGGKTGTAIVRSAVPQDFSIADAQFTQVIQSSDGSIPMVLSGNAAVVNVLISTTAPTSASTPLVLRLFGSSGALLRADTLQAATLSAATPSYAAPTAQFLVAASLLPSIASWQVVRDPLGSIPDANPADDIFPRSGAAGLSKVSVPPINIHFVPIALTSYGSNVGVVTQSQLPEYLHTVRSLHPLGAINATIASPFSSTANFGTPPSGGADTFWEQVLEELDLARVASVSDPDSYWMGILVPPAGFNYTIYGGFGYIPASGGSRNAGTRTAVAVQLGWFSLPTHGRDGIAHELGHNLGRRHAPCGAAASPDHAFPNTSGTIGGIGHNVFAWASGEATSAVTEPATTGDLMGYCTPVWISEYTYRGEMQFRGTTPAALTNPVEATRVLVIRGRIEDNGRVTLQPAFTLTGRVTRPERDGNYRVTGRAADGRVLFTYSFDPAVLDHASNIRHFTFAIPATPALDDSLVTIEVTGAASARLQAAPKASLRTLGEPSQPTAHATAEMVTVTCGDPGARGILALDATTGAVLGTASGPSIRLAAQGLRSVRVACSDGVRTVRNDVEVQ